MNQSRNHLPDAEVQRQPYFGSKVISFADAVLLSNALDSKAVSNGPREGNGGRGSVYRSHTQALEISVSSGYSRDTCAKENTKSRLSSAAKDSQWKTGRMRSRGPKGLSEFHLEGNPELTSRYGPSHRP